MGLDRSCGRARRGTNFQPHPRPPSPAAKNATRVKRRCALLTQAGTSRQAQELRLPSRRALSRSGVHQRNEILDLYGRMGPRLRSGGYIPVAHLTAHAGDSAGTYFQGLAGI